MSPQQIASFTKAGQTVEQIAGEFGLSVAEMTAAIKADPALIAAYAQGRSEYLLSETRRLRENMTSIRGILRFCKWIGLFFKPRVARARRERTNSQPRRKSRRKRRDDDLDDLRISLPGTGEYKSHAKPTKPAKSAKPTKPTKPQKPQAEKAPQVSNLPQNESLRALPPLPSLREQSAIPPKEAASELPPQPPTLTDKTPSPEAPLQSGEGRAGGAGMPAIALATAGEGHRCPLPPKCLARHGQVLEAPAIRDFLSNLNLAPEHRAQFMDFLRRYEEASEAWRYDPKTERPGSAWNQRLPLHFTGSFLRYPPEYYQQLGTEPPGLSQRLSLSVPPSKPISLAQAMQPHTGLDPPPT